MFGLAEELEKIEKLNKELKTRPEAIKILTDKLEESKEIVEAIQELGKLYDGIHGNLGRAYSMLKHGAAEFGRTPGSEGVHAYHSVEEAIEKIKKAHPLYKKLVHKIKEIEK